MTPTTNANSVGMYERRRRGEFMVDSLAVQVDVVRGNPGPDGECSLARVRKALRELGPGGYMVRIYRYSGEPISKDERSYFAEDHNVGSFQHENLWFEDQDRKLAEERAEQEDWQEKMMAIERALRSM